MELRRSRRLAGKEPETMVEPVVVMPPPVVQRGRPAGFCEGAVGFLGSCLATFTLFRAVSAVVSAPGYCLF